MKKPTGRDAQGELKRVKARLTESEATMKAIRSGNVDAVVVDGPLGNRIFTLQSPEEPYRILAERMNEGAATLTKEGTIIFCNPRLAEMVGLPAERLLGSSFSSVLCQGDRPAFPELVQQALEKDRRTEMLLLRNDSTMLQVQLSLSPIPLGESGQGVCLIATDLSDRKRGEEARAWLAAVVESSDDAIITKTVEGVITTWNRGAERLFGYSAAEVIGKPMLMLFPPEFRNEESEILAHIGHGQPVDHFETISLRKDGKSVDISVVISLIKDSAGAIIGASNTARDITQQKAAEREIHKLNQELEGRVQQRTAQLQNVNSQLMASVKELEGFTYSVSHDLRAPLRHLDGFLTLLSKRCYSSLDATAKHYVDSTHEASQRMGTLIDELLQFSRLGHGDMRKVPVNVNELVEQVKRELEPEICNRTIHWHVEQLPIVIADQGMLRQVIGNLLGNSLKFTRQRDVAEIVIGSTFEANGELVIFVRDNGAGFDMQYYNKLFQVFQRLHNEDEFEGTGIGLANVRRMVGRQGGRVWAEGAVGTGSTFYFSLPSGGNVTGEQNEYIEAHLTD